MAFCDFGNDDTSDIPDDTPDIPVDTSDIPDVINFTSTVTVYKNDGYSSHLSAEENKPYKYGWTGVVKEEVKTHIEGLFEVFSGARESAYKWTNYARCIDKITRAEQKLKEMNDKMSDIETLLYKLTDEQKEIMNDKIKSLQKDLDDILEEKKIAVDASTAARCELNNACRKASIKLDMNDDDDDSVLQCTYQSSRVPLREPLRKITINRCVYPAKISSDGISQDIVDNILRLMKERDDFGSEFWENALTCKIGQTEHALKFYAGLVKFIVESFGDTIIDEQKKINNDIITDQQSILKQFKINREKASDSYCAKDAEIKSICHEEKIHIEIIEPDNELECTYQSEHSITS